MKHWAVFFDYDVSLNRYIELCGNFHKVQLDGRKSLANMKWDAYEEMKRRKYQGYRVERGDRLESLFALTAAVQIKP